LRPLQDAFDDSIKSSPLQIRSEFPRHDRQSPFAFGSLVVVLSRPAEVSEPRRRQLFGLAAAPTDVAPNIPPWRNAKTAIAFDVTSK
jgi:hypothetical protein